MHAQAIPMGVTLSGTGDAGLVCRRCGISPPTLRKWVRRFDESGEDGLKNRSRRPAQSPNRRIFAPARALILDLRLWEPGGFRTNCTACRLNKFETMSPNRAPKL